MTTLTELKMAYIYRYDFSIDSSGMKKCRWSITTNKAEALHMDSNFKLATVKDLHDWIAATGEIFTGEIATRDSLVKWTEYDNEFECCSEYEVIKDWTKNELDSIRCA